MGAGRSKEEQLYQAVQNGNHQLVKALRRDGASLEFIDRDGRTPLILACSRIDLFEMVVTLLNLGANINAYRPGSQNGFPLHHAAKRGLEKTVILLISRGVNPLAINDDGETALDMARSRGHTSIVRIIEDRVCLFSGIVREVSSGILEVFLVQWLTKKVWVVVLPTETKPGRPPRFELVIYQSSEVAQPRATIPLWKSDLEEPKWNSSNAALIVTEKANRTRYKFLPGVDGDITQLERLYKACRGVYAIGYPGPTAPGYIPTQQSPTQVHHPAEDAELAMAIDASLMTASAENNGWVEPPTDKKYSGWGSAPEQAATIQKPEQTPDYGGWENGGSSSSYNGWASPNASEARPSNDTITEDQGGTGASAPPLPAEYAPIDLGAPIHYPSVDNSPLNVPLNVDTNLKNRVDTSKVDSSDAAGGDKPGTCVVCWDAPAQGVCIPCGHLAGCMECLTEIKNKRGECPVCRGFLDQVVKVYAV